MTSFAKLGEQAGHGEGRGVLLGEKHVGNLQRDRDCRDVSRSYVKDGIVLLGQIMRVCKSGRPKHHGGKTEHEITQ